MRALLFVAALGAAACTPAPQQAVAPTPCTAAENAQLDFWLGSWDATWDASPGSPAGSGTNTIVKELEGCVVRGAFSGGGTNGSSLSMYDANAQRWRQTWVDDQGSYFDLVGGFEGERLVLVNRRLAENAPYLRVVFEDIAADSFTWRWQQSPDNGATWTDRWLIHYTRRPA